MYFNNIRECEVKDVVEIYPLVFAICCENKNMFISNFHLLFTGAWHFKLESIAIIVILIFNQHPSLLRPMTRHVPCTLSEQKKKHGDKPHSTFANKHILSHDL